MIRTGLSEYTAEGGYDLFGEKTHFRSICSMLVESIVKQGKWFSFCKKAEDSQIDVMSITNDKGQKLGHMINDVYGNSPSYRTSIYKYLLREYMCYFESPIVKQDKNLNGFKNSFNKYLVTSNIHVVAMWLGISVEEAEASYGNRLYGVDDDSEDDFFPYLKLYETKEHVHKVTKPRKDLDLGEIGTRVIPVFALEKGIDALYNLLLEDTYNVKFCKDSGQVRTINTTFNVGRIKEIYKDDYVNPCLESWYQGDFINNPTLERGYIRVFEMGSSIYDSPLRSINYARIIGFEKAEPNLAYINIDIESVIDTFQDYLNSSSSIPVDELVEALDAFEVGTTRSINSIRLQSLSDVEMWVDSQRVQLSTVFLRQLALFMLGNPQWFSGYTGAPKNSYSSTDNPFNTGLELTDDSELGLEIG